MLDQRRVYLHFYYNSDQAAEDEKAFDRRLLSLQRELISGELKPENEKLYNKYFTSTTPGKKGNRITIKDDQVKKSKRYFGFFALMGNEKMEAGEALDVYRTKDVVEKAFGNLKERLNMRRALVSSGKNLDGKIFIQFVALIYLSYIKKQMKDTDLFKTYTLAGLLDQLDVIEYFKVKGREP